MEAVGRASPESHRLHLPNRCRSNVARRLVDHAVSVHRPLTPALLRAKCVGFLLHKVRSTLPKPAKSR